ncbi:MAG: pyridoxamine 5'-phosphate oxidase family protein, partial [Synergistaceae bacterium]|nr:pyridoxamine 5'-phosphate oxidase family protein [Synergistaceae bacterium]
LVRNENPSNFSEKYKSVIGKGEAEFLSDIAEKRAALCVLMRHYSGPTEPMPDAVLERISVVKIKVTELTGKISGYPRDGIE